MLTQVSKQMTQIFSPQELDEKNKQLCCYINLTKQIVIACIKNIPGRSCERVIFPEERFLFEVPRDSYLEISQHTLIGIIKETIPCSELIVNEPLILDIN
jgi:hypothetical protein